MWLRQPRRSGEWNSIQPSVRIGGWLRRAGANLAHWGSLRLAICLRMHVDSVEVRPNEAFCGDWQADVASWAELGTRRATLTRYLPGFWATKADGTKHMLFTVFLSITAPVGKRALIYRWGSMLAPQSQAGGRAFATPSIVNRWGRWIRRVALFFGQ